MSNNFEDVDPKIIAKLLRKPEGEGAKEIAELMYESNKFLTEINYEEINKYNGKSILEIGFGNGKLLSSLFNYGIEKVYGVDYSQEMIDEATKNNQNLINENKITLIHSSIEKINLESNSVDKVVSVNTVYFWSDMKKVLEEIKRVLKPNGYLSIGFRSKEQLKDLPFIKYGFDLYNCDDLEKVLLENNYKIISKRIVPDKDLEAIALVCQPC